MLAQRYTTSLATIAIDHASFSAMHMPAAGTACYVLRKSTCLLTYHPSKRERDLAEPQGLIRVTGIFIGLHLFLEDEPGGFDPLYKNIDRAMLR